MTFARLLIPALRCPRDVEAPDAALALAARGVGGFCVFGWDPRLPALLARLREAAPHPLLFACDLEDGAGQHVHGATRHPPAAALDPGAAEAAGRLTALEARRAGLSMTFAPVCDVASHPDNPIVQARAFPDPAACAPRFVAGARAGGLRTCAKHFPGHGAAAADSHDALPVVDAPAEVWRARDLPPFSACIAAGVDAVMTAHLACPALTGSPDLPATLSPAVLEGLLRGELGFTGLIVADALCMEGVRAGRGEAEAARLAALAGCDALLCPEDPEAALQGLARLPAARVEKAAARVAAAAGPLRAPEPFEPAPLRAALARAAEASVRSRGDLPLAPGPHPLRICDLHGGGEAFARAAGVAYERLDRDGRVVERGGARGLAAPAVAILRRDRAWGGPLALPDSVARLARAARLIVLLGPAALLRGVDPPALVSAPGEDPFTLAAVARRAFPA